MTDTMRRRHLLLEPGEAMFLHADAFALTARAAQFQDLSQAGGAAGFTSTDLFISPVFGHPLPIAKRGTDGKLLPWSDIAPALLWHPLLWLPERLAVPGQVRAPHDGGVREENRLEWAARVAIEVHHAGLWDPATGWLDVLALAGIDIADPASQQRVAAWQAGSPDAALDGIDLSTMFDLERDAGWAYDRAVSLNSLIHPVAMGLHAASMNASLEALESVDDLINVAAACLVTLSYDSVPASELFSSMWDELEQDDADHQHVADVLFETTQAIANAHAEDIAEYHSQLTEAA